MYLQQLYIFFFTFLKIQHTYSYTEISSFSRVTQRCCNFLGAAVLGFSFGTSDWLRGLQAGRMMMQSIYDGSRCFCKVKLLFFLVGEKFFLEKIPAGSNFVLVSKAAIWYPFFWETKGQKGRDFSAGNCRRYRWRLWSRWIWSDSPGLEAAGWFLFGGEMKQHIRSFCFFL